MVSDIRRQVLRNQEEADDQGRSVSDARALYFTKSILTATQTQTRLAIPTTNGSSISYLHLVYLANHLPCADDLFRTLQPD